MAMTCIAKSSLEMECTEAELAFDQARERLRERMDRPLEVDRLSRAVERAWEHLRWARGLLDETVADHEACLS